ncbi:MAG: hypothetical protein JW776_02025 [Candidatus Lokiarchaeota archaeon]|nr:hypothetical protein [Candidatus Lokiarchaeota archaeon]
MNIETTCTELEYYEEIIRYYEDSLSSANQTEIEEWMGSKYISILDDLKSKRPISDAPIEDVAKNAILLILNLFKTKQTNYSSVTWNCLSKQERKLVKEALFHVLEC